MSKIASYLSGHLRGEVMTGPGVREVFSTDGSILKLTPLLVAYPFNTSDVRKITRFAWQLAEKGHVLPLTARGSGSSRTGAAIGQGAIISLQTHMKSILELDTKQKLIRLQPGVNLETLNQSLQTHGLIWPVQPSVPNSTVGGVIANNTFGEYGQKYSYPSDWIDSLEIVTASGECLQITAVNKREFGRKKGLSGAEGDIYRQIDGLLEDNAETIDRLADQAGSAGYNLSQVKDKRGGVNLIPLIAGSQGTLGVITEVILRLAPYHPAREVVAASLSSLDDLESTLTQLKKLEPSRLEFIDAQSLICAQKDHGLDLKELSPENTATQPAGLLVVEFNEFGRKTKSKAKKCAKILDKADHYIVKSDGDFEAAAEIWQIYHRIINTLNLDAHDTKTTAAIVEDAIVPAHEIASYFQALQALAKQHRVKVVLWGHLSSGVMHLKPLLNLHNLSDKQKVDKLMAAYYQMIVKLGGGVAGEYGEGRLRASHAAAQFDSKEIELFTQLRKIFDSHGILNPGVKIISPGLKTAATLSDDYNAAKHSQQLSHV